MSSISLFLPRTTVHFREVQDYLVKNGQPLQISSLSSSRNGRSLVFKLRRDGLVYDCEFLLPGLLLVSSPAANPTQAESVAVDLYRNLTQLWKGIFEPIQEGRLKFGRSSLATTNSLDKVMLDSCLNFVEELTAQIRQKHSEKSNLVPQYLMASEIRQRILQAQTSLRLFRLTIAQIPAIDMMMANSQIRFTLAFVNFRIDRLDFLVKDQIDRGNRRIQWSIWGLTLVLVVLTLVLIIRG